MTADLWIKLGTLISGLIGAAVGLWKVRDELLRSRRGHFRDEYKFAAEFLDAVSRLGSTMHPYLKQKGYQALAGGAHLRIAEIEYLMSFQEPVRALEDYALGKKYLVHLSTAGSDQLEFGARYQNKRRRTLIKFGYLATRWLSHRCFCPVSRSSL